MQGESIFFNCYDDFVEEFREEGKKVKEKELGDEKVSEGN